MGKKLRIGVVGTGKFAGHHVDVWRSIDKVELIGGYGGDTQRLKAFCQKLKIKDYSNYSSLIEASDIIDVASANYTHCDYAIQALEKKKHAIIEKPLDVIYEKAKNCYELSEKNRDVTSSVISQFRFQRAFRKLKKTLDRGLLGEIGNCRLRISWPRDKRYFNRSGGWIKEKSLAGGGVLMHQCIHFIDLLHWFFGEAESVSGKKDCDKDAVEQSFQGEIKFKNGASCQLDLTSNPYSAFMQRLEIFGSKGNVAINGSIISRKTNNGISDIFENTSSYMNRLLMGPEKSTFLLKCQFLNIVDAIRTGSTPLITLKDGLTVLRTVLGLYEASDIGEKVYLNNSGLI